MTEQSLPEESMFLHALDMQSAADRQAYLAQACGDNEKLRAEVEALLRAHLKSGDLLDLSESPDATLDQPITEKPGTVIDRYKLLEQIGEGGFGVVFMAEQEKPVRRKVALKIIKPGMDTKEVIARFEAERQALAIMDHPNIAKVFDAGATGSGKGVGSHLPERPEGCFAQMTPDPLSAGRPYFVMELVRGIPITDFCDQNSLTTRERLELFASVCQAVQHAHQKGIIHRDIKPSNVLVTMHDDTPVPKVIDFGVAKATNARLTERTLFTRFGQMIGTPLYMSPEQAQMSGLDVDTRSDIYSLGVLLYELLTGATPFDRRRIHEAAYDELLRIIREEEPPKPSLRISSLGDTLPSVAAQRKLEPKKLSALVRGELDWIVMKALEKDRTRRYETATSFSADIERYLCDEAVQACPPSAAYRFKKFARRNKVAISTTAVVLLALVGGIIGTSSQAIRASRERDRAVSAEGKARVEADKARSAEQAAREESQRADAEAKRANNEATVATAVKDLLLNDLLAQADIADQPGGEVARDPNIKVRTLLDRAGRSIGDKFADQPLIEADIHWTIGSAYWALGVYQEAELHLERARELWLEALGPEHDFTLLAQNSLAGVYVAQGRYAEAEPLFLALVELQKQVHGLEHADTLLYQSNLAVLYNNSGRCAESETLQQQVLKTRKRVFGVDDPNTLDSQLSLALVYAKQERHPEASTLLSATLDTQKRILGPTHPKTLETQHWLARVYADQQRNGEAESLYRATMEMKIQALGLEHPDTRATILALGELLTKTDRCDEAIALYRQIIEHNSEDAAAYTGLGTAFQQKGDMPEAAAAFKKANEFSGEDASYQISYGRAIKDLGEVDAAIEAFVKSFDYFTRELWQFPDDERLLRNLGVASCHLSRALREQGRSVEALSYLELALELGAKGRFFWIEYALCHRALGNDAEYENACQKLIAEYPAPGERKMVDWGHLSQHLYRVGKYQEARTGLEKTIELRGEDGPSMKNGPRWWYYTLTLGQLGETDRARGYYDQLSQLMKEEPPGNFKLYEDLQFEAVQLLGVVSEQDSQEEPIQQASKTEE